MSDIDYAFILATHFENEQWTLNGDDYEGLTWLSDSVKPTKEELDNLWDATVLAFNEKANEAIAARQAVLDRLGITQDEAKLLLS